jgi:hypothetical protein
MSETLSETKGKVAWLELPAKDTQRARRFYGSLFDWQFQPFEGADYHMTLEAGGAIADASELQGPLIYFGTDDVDAAIARVRELGGEAGERQEIPGEGFGSYAHCRDTEGNPFGLYQA